MNSKGKFELDYYTICGANTTDRWGNKGKTYWIVWLDNGSETCGFDSAELARKTADTIVRRSL